MALRLLVYDRTCAGRGPLPGLTTAWRAGRRLYGALGRVDAALGASSWAEALDWLATHRPEAPLTEIQYWGHGTWGAVRIGGEALDVTAFAPDHPHHQRLRRIAARLRPGAEGLVWFRTCETFGSARGHSFARACATFFGCRVAGHTHVIGFWQSGLHSLLPGQEPAWSADEGLPPGNADPRTALPSRPGGPHTITCFHGRIPPGY